MSAMNRLNAILGMGLLLAAQAGLDRENVKGAKFERRVEPEWTRKFCKSCKHFDKTAKNHYNGCREYGKWKSPMDKACSDYEKRKK